MKLSMEQAVKLDNLRETHAELMMSRTNLRARIEKELENQLSVLRQRRSRLANECIKAGVSKTKVGRAMGTTDWKTITTILAETVTEFTAETEGPIAPYRLDGLDDEGSPSALIFETYKDRVTGERMNGPVVVPLRRIFEDDPRVTFEETPESDRIDRNELFDAVLAINKTFQDKPEPVAAPADDYAYAARFFVPDDDGEDD